MLSKILSLVLSVIMLFSSAPVDPLTAGEISNLIDGIGQKISDSVDGFVESLGQKAEDKTSENKNINTEADTNNVSDILALPDFSNQEEFEVKEQADTWDGTVSQVVATPAKNATYTIDSAEELAWLAQQVNAGTNATTNKMGTITFNLTVDIDLGGRAWTPIGGIGSTSKYFNGTFNGNGHTISGLNVTSDKYNVGLFGYIYDDANINNLGLINPQVTWTEDSTTDAQGCGALIGRAYGSTVTKCFVRGGKLTSSKAISLGGLIGYTSNTVAVSHCYAQGVTVDNNDTDADASAGGIVGIANTAADNFNYCYSTAICTTSSSKDNAGAIAGHANADVKVVNCYGASDVGGSANTLIGEYSASNDDGISGGGMVTGATLKGYCFPTRTANDTLNGGGRIYFKDSKTINGGYPIFEKEYAFPNHYAQWVKGVNFYNNRTTLSAYAAINGREPGLFTTLNNANNAILSYMQSAGASTSDATSTSQYVAVTNAINAINAANTKYASLINKINEGQTFYNNRTGLAGWAGISKNEPGLVTALQTALTNANNWVAGTNNTGTIDSHITAIQNAINALNTASTKYATATYAPTLSLSAPGIIFVSGTTIPATTVVLTSNYELATRTITATNGTNTYTLSGPTVATSGSGASKVWTYTFTLSGTVTNPATAGTLTYTATGKANNQTKTVTATSSCAFVTSPVGKNAVTMNFKYAHEYDVGLWTDGHAWLQYNFYVTGLHTMTYTERNDGKRKTTAGENNSMLYSTYEDHSGSQKSKTFSDNNMFYGGFYCDLNTANTFAAANGATTIRTVKFKPENVGNGTEEYVTFKADNEEYLDPISRNVITNSGTAIAQFDSGKEPSERNVTPEGTVVTYTLTGSAADESARIKDHVATFTITYYFVDSTKLWLLFKSEESIARHNYSAFYSANNATAWTEYDNAYKNAVQALQGGLPQTTIDEAYTRLCNAIVGLKGKINYNTNGGSGTVSTPQIVPIYSAVEVTASNTVSYTYAIVTLASYSGLTKTGYICKGWATTSSKTATDFPSNNLTMTAARATAAFTLYAAWAPITYTVKYNANPPSGSTSTGSVASQSCAYNTSYNTQANSFVVANYKFVKWNTNAAGTGTSYNAGASFKNLTTTNGATINLYAIWEPDTVNVTFNINLPSGVSATTSGFKANTTKALTIGSTQNIYTGDYKLAAVGYNHIGWATSASATTANFTTSYTVPNTAQTLYAVWQKKSIKVSYTVNGGTLGTSGFTANNSTVQYGGTVDLPNADQITRAGYNLTGWRASVANASGTTFFNAGTNYVVPDATGTITFSAEWTERTTVYTFHHNNNANSDYTTTISGKYNTAISSAFPTPTAMTGYTFTGWYVKDGTGYKAYTKPSNFPANDVVLYAGWSMDALSFEIGRFPTDIDNTGVYPSTGETKYWYQEPGRTNAKTELTQATAVYTANNGELYDYTKITETNTATTELRTAIDALIDTPADYKQVNVFLEYYAEILDNNHTLTGDHPYAGNGPVNKDSFTADSFAAFEDATDIFEDLGLRDQATVNGYASTLETTYNNLEPTSADYSQFEWYLNEALTLNTIIGTEDTSLEEFFGDTWGLLWYEEGSWYAFFEYAMIYNYDLPRDLNVFEQATVDAAVGDLQALYEGMTPNPPDYSVYDADDGKMNADAVDVNNGKGKIYQENYADMVTAANTEIINAKNNGELSYRYDQPMVDKLIQDLADLLADPQYKSYDLIFMLNDGTDEEVDRKTLECVANIAGQAPEDPQREGFIFLGWFTTPEDNADETGYRIDFTSTEEVLGTSNRILYARWEKELSAYTLDVKTTYSNVYLKFNEGTESLQGNKYTNDEVLYGTKVTLRAVPDGDNREFMYWKDNRNRIVSYEETLTFTLEADWYLVAVYSEAAESGYYSVTFVDSILKTIISEQKVAAGEAAKAPDIAETHGEYTFVNWNADFNAVTENMIITSVYVLSSELFTITTVIEGKEDDVQTYRYNAPVTIKIEDKDIPGGKVFAGWKINEKVVSYDRTYKFYAYKNMTVTAVFADTLEEVKAIVTLTTEIKEPTTTTYKVEFMVTREIPEDYIFISSGLLLTQSADFSTNETLTFEAQSENTSAIRLYRTVHTDNDGQYMLTVKTSSGKTFYARGFIVYINGDGEVITDYTDVVSVTDK